MLRNKLKVTMCAAAGLVLAAAAVATAQMSPGSAARYTKDGKLMRPEGYHRWVFIGSPLTPNGLNGGEAGFPEFHNVYAEPSAFEEFKRTGTFPEGTVIVKELLKVHRSDFADGSAMEPSGRGFFQGAFNGIDVIVKDKARYAETSGWGFFNFGHHAPPYEEAVAAAPREACAFCHEANAKSTDMVFQRLYPVLGATHTR